jgi:TolB protein
VPANDEFNNYDEAELWMANYDGSNQRKVIDLADYNWSAQGVADWSPDGKELAMAVTDSSGLWGIYITDAEGNNPQKISQRKSLYADPSWSPDGQKIVYSAFPEGYVGINTFKLEVHIMNRDGSNETRLTFDEFQDHDPYWSPDGKEIAFETLWGLSNCSVIGKWGVRKYSFDSEQTTFIIQDENATGIPRWTRDSTAIYLGRTVCGELTKVVKTDREGKNLETVLSDNRFPIYDVDIVELEQ